MIQYNLHKLPEGFIITSDETPIKKGELYYNIVNYQIFKLDGVVFNHCKKVIAQQHQIDFSALSGEEQKEIGWFDVEKLSLQDNEFWRYGGDYDVFETGFKAGFQKAQELLSDRRFTLEDIEQAMIEGLSIEKFWEKCVQSLSQPKSWKVEGILENDKFKITKIL
jgi:hypothetical protein